MSRMGELTYSFTAEVWEQEGPGRWHFVSLPEDAADEIEALAAPPTTSKGFGSVRVDAVIGSSRWSTSIFPDTRRKTYVLPVKKAVRQAESLSDGTTAHVELTIADPP